MNRDLKALDVVRRAVARTPVLHRGLAYTIMLAIVATIGRLAVPILVQQTIDRGRVGSSDPRLEFVAVACLATLAVVAVTAVLAAWSATRMVPASQESLFELRVAAFRRVHDLSVAEHSSERRGELLARVTSDVESVSKFLRWGAIAWVVNSALVIGSVVAMFMYSWQLALVAVGAFALMIPILKAGNARQLVGYDRIRSRTARLMATFSETLAGAAVIRAYGYEEPTRSRVRGDIDDLVTAQSRTARYAASLFTLGDVVGAGAFALVTLSAVIWGDAWDLRVGQVVLFIFLVNLVLVPVGELVELLDDTQTAVAGWNKVLVLLDRPPAVPEPISGVALPAGPLAVSVRDVSFSYDGQVSVLEGVTADIPAMSHVAVVGETGAGKSTFAALLCRLADPTAGTIEVGGVDLTTVDPASRRAHIALIPQDGFVFDTTIAENLRFGRRTAERSDLLAAFESLGLRWWVEQLPSGLDTTAGIAGGNLSVGERQLVALARAQLADPGLLVLDEATSAVDARIDAALNEALARLTAERTTVSIAHRLSTAESADLILVFNDGRLVESGPHRDLVTAGGRYAQLHRSWLGGPHRAWSAPR